MITAPENSPNSAVRVCVCTLNSETASTETSPMLLPDCPTAGSFPGQGGVVTATDLATLVFTTSVIPAPNADIANKAILSFSNAAGAVQLQPGPPQSGFFDLSHLQLWALLVRKIQDATGAPRLSCVSIFVQDPCNPKQFIWQDSENPGSLIDRTNCIVYLVEVLTV